MSTSIQSPAFDPQKGDFQTFSNSPKNFQNSEPSLFMKKVGNSAKTKREERQTEKILMTDRDQMMENLKQENDELKLLVQKSREEGHSLKRKHSELKGGK